MTAWHDSGESRRRIEVRRTKSRRSGGSAGEHLGAEIVQDVAVGAGERVDEGADVAVASRERRRGERDAGGPALGAPGEAVHVVRAEIDPGNGGEHPGDLVGVEGEVVGPQLLQFTGGPQPAEREGRIPPGGDDDVDVLGHPFHEERDGLVHGPVGDHVVVVEHEHDRPGLARSGR